MSAWPSRRVFCGMALVLGLLAVALAPSHLDAQNLSQIDRAVLAYKQASFVWMDRLYPFARWTFGLLAALEFAVSGILMLLREKSDTEDMGMEFIRKFMWTSAWYTVLATWELWIPPMFEGFRRAGILASGRSTLNPSEIVSLGSDMQAAIGLAASDWMRFNPISGATIQFAGLIVLFAFAAAAVAVSYTLVQGFLTMGAGVLFLGFASWRSTAQLTDNYLGMVVYVGIKLMVLFLVVGLGTNLAAEMVRITQTMHWTDMSPAAQIVFMAFLFAATVLGLPVWFASRITQGHNFGLVSAIRARSL